MEIFLDSANLKEIEEINSLGIIKGVTTNPTLISKEKTLVSDLINLCKSLNVLVFIQTVEEDYLKIYEEGRYYFSLYPEGLLSY